MDASVAVDEACRATGLDDFGGESFREGLEVLTWSLAEEARLHDHGAQIVRNTIVATLANRLRVVAWTAEHPQVGRRPVERPLFVIGLPRTGSTLLTYVLHQDPANRCLLRWEARQSVPPPDPANVEQDPRLARMREADRRLHSLNPSLRAIRYESPDGPTECLALLAQDFKSVMWEVMANVPAYGAWLSTCDHSSAYAYHHRVLQLLQWRWQGRWVLKSPQHCVALPSLVSMYPDARFVMLHRDPLQSVASMCSLVQAFSSTYSHADHRGYIARRWPAALVHAVEAVSAFRDRHGDEAFHDVHYTDLAADPMGTVRVIYSWLGEELEPDVERRMAAYLEANPPGRWGEHNYSLEDMGLDERMLADRFAGYCRRYGVATGD